MKRRGRAALATVGFLHPGDYSQPFADSLTDLLFHDAAGAQRLMHRFGKLGKLSGSGGIVAGRNQIARAVLDESQSQWLLMIDSDMGFEADTLERLIAAADPVERPVVGGLCFAAKFDGRASFYGVRYRAQPTLYDFVEEDERVGVVPRFVYPPDELVPVGATGAACLLVHRNVLATIRERFGGDVWFDQITHPKGPTTFSEDISFCFRIAACDLPVHVHTGVKTGHDKGFAFLDEDFYVAQEKAAGRVA